MRGGPPRREPVADRQCVDDLLPLVDHPWRPRRTAGSIPGVSRAADQLPGPGRRPADGRRFGLLRDLERPRDVVAHLGPNWFASIMGTGIVANAAATLPVRVPGLRVAATVVRLAASVLLVGLSAAWVAHWVLHPRTARAHASNAVMASFFGAPPMALLTVGAGTLLTPRRWPGSVWSTGCRCSGSRCCGSRSRPRSPCTPRDAGCRSR